jgi:Dolichyl-phosphate-mannose-protein mannosyltransferase
MRRQARPETPDTMTTSIDEDVRPDRPALSTAEHAEDVTPTADDAPPRQHHPPRHRRPARFGISPTFQAVGLVALITLINASWALRDHTTPSWDQSHYLTLTLIYQHALDHHGPVALIRALYTTDPGRAPFFTLAMLPFSYLFHSGPGSGMALNVALWPVLLLSGGAIAKELFDHRARMITILLLSVLTTLTGLAHTELQDFLLVTLSTLAVWLIIRTRNLQSWKASLGLGIVITLGTLTKVSFILVIVGPLLVLVGSVGYRFVSTRRREMLRWPLINFVIIAAVTIGPILIWYVPNWNATRAYLNEALAVQPGTVSHPLALANLKTYAVTTIDNGFGLLVILFTLAVALLSIPNLVKWLRTRDNFWPSIKTALILLSWLVIPIVTVGASTNQAPRYAVEAYPALVVIAGGLTSGLRWASVRVAAMVVAVLITINATLTVNVAGYKPPGLPAYWSIDSPVGTLTAQIGAAPAFLPLSANYGLDVIKYLESQSKGPDGKVEHRTIALLELQGYLNGNNLPYLATLRRDPFTFATLFAEPKASALTTDLKGYDFVVYIKQPGTIPGGAGARVAQLNNVAAARQMTLQDFALFKNNPARIFVGADQEQGDYALILERKR